MISGLCVGHPTLRDKARWKLNILYRDGQGGQLAKLLCGGRSDVSIFWVADLVPRDPQSTGTRRISNGERARSRMMIPAMTLPDVRHVLAVPCRDCRSCGTGRCTAVELFVMLAEARKRWNGRDCREGSSNKLLIDQWKSARAYLAAARACRHQREAACTRKG